MSEEIEKGYPEAFINDLWTSMPLNERIDILELASVDLDREYKEWLGEFNRHEMEMEEALGITGEMKKEHGNWGKEDDNVDLNRENQ